jgi:hypothetical protein
MILEIFQVPKFRALWHADLLPAGGGECARIAPPVVCLVQPEQDGLVGRCQRAGPSAAGSLVSGSESFVPGA